MSLTTIISLVASAITIFESFKIYHKKVLHEVVLEVINELEKS